jgi:hypothetical protein
VAKGAADAASGLNTKILRLIATEQRRPSAFVTLKDRSMAIRLFEPLELRGVTLPNRIVVEPMTQFSAEAGVAGDWHLMHLGQFAVSGAAMVFTESTYVAAEARNYTGPLFSPRNTERSARNDLSGVRRLGQG